MFAWFQQNNSSVVNQKQQSFGSTANVLMQASRKYQGYMKVGEVLHLQGPHISLDALCAAIRRLQRRHPVLRSRLQINPKERDSYLLVEDDTLQLDIHEISRNRVDHLIFWRQVWREREKQITAIGQGLAEFWLLQDPDDDNNASSPREIVVVCEHSVCDGLSLSTVAHELLISLSDDNNYMFVNSLNWPPTMETAIHRSLSLIGKLLIFIRFIFVVLFLRITDTLKTARIPLAIVDFPLTDMVDYCHTESCYGMINKEETQKLVDMCRQRGITVTSAVSSAIVCSASTLINSQEDQSTALRFSIEADSRRRYASPVSNHDLSYHVSGIIPFTTRTKDVPTTCQDMWLLAKTFGHHVKTSIEAGYILAFGMLMGMICQKNLESLNLADLPTCDISSWGVLPFHEQYGPWKLVAMTPSLNIIRSLIPLITIQTVNGILTIMYAGAGPLIRLSTLENLRDRTMQKLHEMIRD